MLLFFADPTMYDYKYEIYRKRADVLRYRGETGWAQFYERKFFKNPQSCITKIQFIITNNNKYNTKINNNIFDNIFVPRTLKSFTA